MLPPTATLVLIDVQRGFEDPRWGPRNNPQAETNIAQLLQAWRAAGLPLVHVQHLSREPDSPLRPGQSGCEFKPEALPAAGEPIFQKSVNSAFIGTTLESYLREHGLDTLVLVGLTTNHCVSTTARMAGNLGFSTFVVADATATYARYGYDGTLYSAEQVHAIALANLHGEFATVLETPDVMAALRPPQLAGSPRPA